MLLTCCCVRKRVDVFQRKGHSVNTEKPQKHKRKRVKMEKMRPAETFTHAELLLLRLCV